MTLFTFLENIWSESGPVKCVKDSLGETVCVRRPQPRVVSLAPSLTELIFALKAGSRLVGRTTKCNIPEAAKKVTDVGAYTTPDFERVMAVRPDLVFAPRIGIRPEFIERLKSLKIPVYIDDSSNIEEIEQLVNNVGKLVGAENEADRIVNDIKIRRAKITKLMRGHEKPTVLFVIGIRPLVVAGGKSFLGALVREAGGSNIAEFTAVEYPKFSIEEVIRRNPDIIFMLDKECQSDDCVKQWKDYGYLKAIRNNRVYVLDADLISRPGSRTIEALEKLAEFLHPDIFAVTKNSIQFR
ncbi:MAG: ABC transporter substrate-binding protein [Desulfomonilaceae bacterium]